MVSSEFEIARWTKLVSEFIEKRRPGKHLRQKIDYGFKIQGQSIELYTVMPRYNSPKEIIESGFAKATYVRAGNKWKVYWLRADLKWHKYGEKPEVKTIEEWIRLVDQDEHGCFFG